MKIVYSILLCIIWKYIIITFLYLLYSYQVGNTVLSSVQCSNREKPEKHPEKNGRNKKKENENGGRKHINKLNMATGSSRSFKITHVLDPIPQTQFPDAYLHIFVRASPLVYYFFLSNSLSFSHNTMSSDILVNKKQKRIAYICTSK